MNGVNSREVATESLPQSPHERIQACLKNLFALPTTNIESAFQLILGLVKEQSSKIDGLNRAHVEAVEGNAKICASMQNVVDGLLKENFGLSVDLRKLKEEHGDLLLSHATISCTLDKLRHDIELTYNLLGDVECEPDSAEEENTKTQVNVVVDTNHSSRGMEVTDITEGTKIEEVASGVNVNASSEADEQSENSNEGATTDHVREEGQPAKVNCSLWSAVAKVNSERSVAARLHQLEQSLSSFMDIISIKGQIEGQPTERQDEALEDVKRRINCIETFLHGFGQDHKKAIATVEEELKQLYEAMPFEENESALATARDVKGDGPAKPLRQENNHVDPTSMPGVLPQGRTDTTQLGRNEGNTETMTIDDLTHHSSALRDSMQQRQVGEAIENQICELKISVKDKVSIREFETRIQEVRNFISTCSAASSTSLSRTVIFDKEQKIMDEISNLKLKMMDMVSYKQQLEQIGGEISKLRLDVSTNAERTDHDLIDIQSVIESQRDKLERLCNDNSLPSNGSSMKEESINAKIQEAADALRVSLDERIDKVRLIENEMEGFASKLAEKPSQDQIESMLRHLEKRLGHDVVLQGIIENMTQGKCYPRKSNMQKFCSFLWFILMINYFCSLLELKQKMSKNDVMAMVKQKISEAKLGMQNTKDALMIGATPSYCLGCGKTFPTGVNGIRAPKINHDALPLNDARSRRRVSPLQAFHGVNNIPRPASAIVGAFAPSSTIVHNMHKQL
ncbi:hypothetical protein ACHAW5_001518 [Stephanodiscus triporus]|uniref:Uncharacterized protein n=1 Tax=Stephanodiscus triporus TaxID=2934178 RepID=A0ABD3P1V0_9STRA